MLPLLLLFAVPDVQASTLRATVRVNGADLEVVSAWVERSETETQPGDLTVINADGEVLTTAALPPLATHRAVSTPEGHESARHPSSLLRVAVPWPEGATSIQAGGRTLSLTARDGEPQPGPGVARVRGDGPSNRRLDLVILSEGYTEAEEAKFDADVARVVAHLDQLEPFATYGYLVDIWRGFVPSADSGIDPSPPAAEPGQFDTPFDCHYGCEGIGRLVCCDEEGIVAKLDEIAAFADGVLLLSNSEVYGGSGGEIYSVAFTGAQGPEVSAHELAHSLVLLWDEYSYGIEDDPDDDQTYISPNCSPADQPPPWQHWMDDEHPEIGVYPTCSFTNWVRPTPGNCMMNSLQRGWCPVCREHMVKQMYRRLGHNFTTSADPPPDRSVRIREGESVTFTVEALAPSTGLSWEWSMDGELLSTDPGSYSLGGCGNLDTELILTLRDDTPWVRSDPWVDLVSVVNWPVRTDRCEGDPARACGCDGAGAGPWWLGLAALAWRRRWSR
jgi:hypothetical protein